MASEISREDRLRALLEASTAIASELSLEMLLQRLVATAADLTGARYAALGVIDRSGLQLEQFITTGVDDQTHHAIGELPRGRGILGVLITEATPLRLHDLGEDARSVGFPANHPPMQTFLGVPILLRGVAYGNFYLTEKDGGQDFTDEDQEIVTLLAAQAAIAIENARLYEATTRWSSQLESLNEVGNALATETDVDRLLDLVARRLRELLDARLVAVMLPVSFSSPPSRVRRAPSPWARRSRSPRRRAAASSSAARASAAIPCSTIPRWTVMSFAASARGPASGCRSSRIPRRSG
jgi:transcriptional regulator with GAF, ATPase, and Fis domain